MGRCSRTDVATLGFAISRMTSASVALADCFLVFLLAMYHHFTRFGSVKGQFGSVDFSLSRTARIKDEVVNTFSSFRSSDLSQSI
jgi:hypothetical protein